MLPSLVLCWVGWDASLRQVARNLHQQIADDSFTELSLTKIGNGRHPRLLAYPRIRTGGTSSDEQKRETFVERQSENTSKSQEPNLLKAEVLQGESSEAMLLALKFRLMTQAAPSKWRKHLSRIEEQLREGQLLQEVIHSRGRPRDLQCLLEEAAKVPEPAALMFEAVDSRRKVWQRWREFRNLLIYPICLLIATLFMILGIHFAVTLSVDFGYLDSFGFGGATQLIAQWNDQRQAVQGAGICVAWVLAISATLYFLGPPWAWLSVAGALVLVGKPLRWISLHEILERYRFFITQKLSPSEAASAVARTFQHSAQGIVAQNVAERVHAGVPLGQALSDCQLSDALCRPALALLDSSSEDMPSRVQQLGNLLAKLADERCRTLGSLIPLLMLIFVALLLWSLVSTYLMMVISVMPLLSWF